MVRRLSLLVLSACTQLGGGGDPGVTGGVVDLDGVGQSEAGFMAERSLSFEPQRTEGALQMAGLSVWHHDEEEALSLVAGLQVDACMEDCSARPADVVVLLDVSDSMSPDEHPEHRLVTEIVSDHVREGTLALVAFRTEPVTLVEPDGPRTWALEAADALETLPELDALHKDLPMVLDGATACSDTPESLLDQVIACEESFLETGWLAPGCGGAIIDGEITGAVMEGLDLLQGWSLSENVELYPGLCSLMEDAGTALVPSLQHGFALLPDGTDERTSLLVMVTDAESEEDPEEIEALALDAARRFVGTTSLGIASDAVAEGLGSLPGGVVLRSSEVGVAVGELDARMDALLAPVAWGLEVHVKNTGYWEVERVFGADHEVGAPTLFATDATVPLLVDLTPKLAAAADNPPVLSVWWWTPGGAQQAEIVVEVPIGALTAGHVAGDLLPLMELVARRDVFDAGQGRVDEAWAEDGLIALEDALAGM